MAPGGVKPEGLTFSWRLGSCNACENRRSLRWVPGEKKCRKVLDRETGIGYKNSCRCGGLEKNPLDSGIKMRYEIQ